MFSMKNILFCIGVWLCSQALIAQPINRATPAAMAKAAEEARTTNNPYAALEFYEKVFSETKDKAISVKIAALNYELRDYAKVETSLGRILARDKEKAYTDLRYIYGKSLMYNGKYQDAIEALNQLVGETTSDSLKALAKLAIEGCEMAKKAKPVPNLQTVNIGKKVNTPQTESSPVGSGTDLYYSGMSAKGVITLDGKQGDWYAKIYTAQKGQEGAEYSEPKALGEQINREGWHQGNVYVTADGKTMYFTRVQLTNNVVSESKIFYSTRGGEGWLGAQEVSGVNGEYIAKHPCEGELFGEKVLFFVSNATGGKGGWDLYYAPKKSEGVFGSPVNIEVLNTSGDELSPFYRDGKLTFSTDGRPTLGGLDVFESQWNGSVWSAPRNLGLGVNSSVDDQYFVQNADGYGGFLVSNRPGPNNLKSKTCCDDIYAWEIERIKVNLLAKTFRYKRKNEKENPSLTGCTVQMFDLGEKGRDPRKVQEQTNPAAGDFPFPLEPEKAYMLIATRDGYVPDTIKFNTVGIKKTVSIEKRLTLRTVRKPTEVVDSIVIVTNEPIRLSNIYYDFNDDKILKASEEDLQFITDLMTKYPDMKIELLSHTDAQGTEDYNKNLSQRRAESARRWILNKGIAGDRIAAVGYGEEQILNQCTNGVECEDEDHRFNRRTEFKITAGPTSITIERKEKRPAAPSPALPRGEGGKKPAPGGNKPAPVPGNKPVDNKPAPRTGGETPAPGSKPAPAAKTEEKFGSESTKPTTPPATKPADNKAAPPPPPAVKPADNKAAPAPTKPAGTPTTPPATKPADNKTAPPPPPAVKPADNKAVPTPTKPTGASTTPPATKPADNKTTSPAPAKPATPPAKPADSVTKPGDNKAAPPPPPASKQLITKPADNKAAPAPTKPAATPTTPTTKPATGTQPAVKPTDGKTPPAKPAGTEPKKDGSKPQPPGGGQSVRPNWLKLLLDVPDTLNPTVPTQEQAWVNPADQLARFRFESLHFGTLKSGERVVVQYPFTNIGKEPLAIEMVSACDCIEANWTRTDIAPGAEGMIEITYDGTDKSGAISKDIDVIFKNTDEKGYPLVKRVLLTGKMGINE